MMEENEKSLIAQYYGGNLIQEIPPSFLEEMLKYQRLHEEVKREMDRVVGINRERLGNVGVDFMKNNDLPPRWLPYRDYIERKDMEEMMINGYIAGVDPYAMRRNEQFINTAQIYRSLEDEEYPNEDGIFK